MSGNSFHGGDVNQVLRTVVALAQDGPSQLSMLTMALMVACRSCDVPKEAALHALGEAFDRDYELIPLPKASG